MEFRDTKYVEIELTNEEKDILQKAKGVVDEIHCYMLEKEKNVLIYATYDGEMSMDLRNLADTSYDLENLINTKGVE